MRFARPEYLTLLALVPVVALWFIWALRRRRVLLQRLGQRAQIDRLLGSVRSGVEPARAAILTLALAPLVVAMARPQFGDVEETVLARGVDVMIAVDVSTSMLAQDVEPSRLARARDQLSELARRLRGNRVGIIAFAGAPVLQCPLTMDLPMVLNTLSIVNPDAVSAPGTSLSSAIRLAMRSFDEESPRHRVLVLLTDGEDHRGEVAETAEEAAEAGLVIHAIGIGSEEGAVVPDYDRRTRRIEGVKRDESGNPVITRLGTDDLNILAEQTGGSAFHTSSLGQVEIDRIARAIEALPQEAIEEERVKHMEEQYQLFLCPAIALLILDALLLAGRRRRRRWLVQRAAVAGAMLLLSVPSAMAEPGARLNNEAVERMDEGQMDEALEMLLQAQVENPEADPILLNLGLTHDAQGNPDEAERHFQEAAASEDTELASVARYNLGTVRLHRAMDALDAGDSEAAQAELERAMDPLRAAVLMGDERTETRRNLEIAQSLLQELQKQQEEQQQHQGDEQQENQDDQSEGDQQQQQQNQDQESEQQQDQQQSQDQQSQEPQESPEQEQQQSESQEEGETQEESDQQQAGESEPSDAEREMTPDQIEEMEREQEEQRQQALAEAILDLYPFEEDENGMRRLMNTSTIQTTEGPDW